MKLLGTSNRDIKNPVFGHRITEGNNKLFLKILLACSQHKYERNKGLHEGKEMFFLEKK